MVLTGLWAALDQSDTAAAEEWKPAADASDAAVQAHESGTAVRQTSADQNRQGGATPATSPAAAIVQVGAMKCVSSCSPGDRSYTRAYTPAHIGSTSGGPTAWLRDTIQVVTCRNYFPA